MEPVETERLVLRRPTAADAPAIFARYASDPEVTRYMAWPRLGNAPGCATVSVSLTMPRDAALYALSL